MRVSQPTLAATDWPYFEASEYASAEELAAKAPTARSQSEHLDALYPDMTEWERAELLSWRTNPALAGERDTLAQIRSAFELEARSSLLSNETHTAPAWKEGAASMSTLRDFPVSDLLMLPASFGTVCAYNHLGLVHAADLIGSRRRRDLLCVRLRQQRISCVCFWRIAYN